MLQDNTIITEDIAHLDFNSEFDYDIDYKNIYIKNQKVPENSKFFNFTN